MRSVACCGAVVRAKIWMAAGLIALAGCGGQSGQGTNAAANGPDAAALALRAAATDPRAARFYEARGWRTAWTRQSEEALIRAIGAADQHGLDKGAFLAPVQQARTGAGHDAALSIAALNYAEALA